MKMTKLLLMGTCASALIAVNAAVSDAAELVCFKAQFETGAELAVTDATRMEYELGATFPGDAGALEVRLRPTVAPTAPCEILRIAAPTAAGFTIVLSYAPNGQRWLFRAQGRNWQAELAAWHGQVRIGEWNHLLLTWDREDEKSFALFLNGVWLTSQPYDGRMAGAPRLEITGGAGMDVALGPIAIYNRCLTKPQAHLLAVATGSADDRMAALASQIALDDQIAARRRDLVARLQGKVGRIYHTRGRKPGPVPLPEGVVAEGIRPEDLGHIDLARFAVLYFPQGPNFQINPDQYPAIKEFVKNGGGYVGDCQGAYFAAEKLQLLPITCYYNNIWGLYKILVKPHFVTDNRQAEITMHFGNGPIMVAGEGCTVIGTYAMKLPGDVTPAAIITGQYGAGRVVVFGTHPMGDKVAFKGTRAHFSGKLLETERMFVNALLLAAGLVDEDGTPR